MCVLKLTKEEYDVLNKIASRSKMDCWFLIQESDDGTTDFVVDLENGTKMSLAEGIIMLNEGINYPNGYIDCGLDRTEIAIYENLISRIPETEDCQESDNTTKQDSTITDDVNNLLLTFFNGAICDAKDYIDNESIALSTCGIDEDNSHGHNIAVLEGFIDRIDKYIKAIENKEVSDHE